MNITHGIPCAVEYIENIRLQYIMPVTYFLFLPVFSDYDPKGAVFFQKRRRGAYLGERITENASPGAEPGLGGYARRQASASQRYPTP